MLFFANINAETMLQVSTSIMNRDDAAFPFDTAPKYLLRDRDRIYGEEFRKQVEVMNIKEVLSAPRSSWQRAYLERVIGSIRNRLIVPIDTTGSKTGTIRKRQRLGGLLNYYYRTAA